MSSRRSRSASPVWRAGLLHSDSPLPYAVELPVLGMRTRFESNSPAVMELVEMSFGGWRVLDVHHRSGRKPLSVAIRVDDVHSRTRNTEGAGAVDVHHVWPDRERLLVVSAAGGGVADPLRRRSVASISSTLLAQTDTFRGMVLEGLTYGLLSHFDRYPAHAAAVARGGVALLLAGRSGAGKSTLAYAAHRAGLSVLGDDHVWLQLESGLRIWGVPNGARLLPEVAARWRNCDAGVLGDRDRRGKVRLSLGTPTQDCLVATSAVVCILAPGATRAALERLSADAVADALTEQLSPGFDRFPERHVQVLRALTPHGGWRLHLTRDPLDALPLLADLLS